MDGQNKLSIAELLGGCTATAFILTIIYIYAFSIPMHWTLFQYFVLDDYLKLAIQWLIPSAVGYLIFFPIGIMLGRNQHKTEAVTKPKSLSLTRMIVGGAMLSIIFLSPIVVWVLYIFGRTPINLFGLYGISAIPIALVCVGFTKWYIARIEPSVREPFTGYHFLVSLAPFLILIPFYNGLADAELLKEGTKEMPKTRLTLSEAAPPMQGQIIFLLDKYVLFLKQNETTVTAIPTALIKSIEELPGSKSKSDRK